PWNAPRMQSSPPQVKELERMIKDSGKAAVSNLFFARLLKQYVIAVSVPVERTGPPNYFLGAGIPAERFAEILRAAFVNPEYVATIIDRSGVIVARSQKGAEFTGKPLTTDFVLRATGQAGVDE